MSTTNSKHTLAKTRTRNRKFEQLRLLRSADLCLEFGQVTLAACVLICNGFMSGVMSIGVLQQTCQHVDSCLSYRVCRVPMHLQSTQVL